MKNEVEEELLSDQENIENIISNTDSLVTVPPIIESKKVDFPQSSKFSDTLIYDSKKQQSALFRQLSETKLINGQYYKITVRDMLIDTEEIIMTIVFTFLLIILLVFIFLFYLNKSHNAKLWMPFFSSLEKLKKFSLTSNETMVFEESEIVEFEELNKEVLILTKKVQADYQNLKQFTEDVSHEMQTPLAIIGTKIESFLNEATIKNKEFLQLSSLKNDINRLKQLNKKLVLLTKLDNEQFSNIETIDVNEELDELVLNFRELSLTQICYEPVDKIVIEADRHLIHILLNNLMTNAIKYCIEEGSISLITKTNSLIVSNTGKQAIVNPEKLFNRFYRENKQFKSTGLGLAIVKKICERYDYDLTYYFESNSHHFKIGFLKTF
ncbi:sensor histidine kinase [Flagellimonas zhangzhouensis]|uniref:sensor histidine kinase n=1 Tax=Flagellimonas zhangzhouensis TaxID=1073328 RepID=UPI001FE01A40|nr:HAMP domain-containing sensor histidine kinase [Allomuricauda zhangzhouensis]